MGRRCARCTAAPHSGHVSCFFVRADIGTLRRRWHVRAPRSRGWQSRPVLLASRARADLRLASRLKPTLPQPMQAGRSCPCRPRAVCQPPAETTVPHPSRSAAAGYRTRSQEGAETAPLHGFRDGCDPNQLIDQEATPQRGTWACEVGRRLDPVIV